MTVAKYVHRTQRQKCGDPTPHTATTKPYCARGLLHMKEEIRTARGISAVPENKNSLDTMVQNKITALST